MEKDGSLLYACYINDIELIKERLKNVKPTQLKKSTQETGTPLHAAARHNNTQAMDLLIKAGADLDKGDFLQNSPLLMCIMEKNLDAAKYLIEHGANVNKKGLQNRNALDLLIGYAWNKDFAKYLLDKGCLINATARDKETILQSAAAENNIEAINFLLENGIERTYINDALCWAITYNAPSAVKCLLNAGGDLQSMYDNCKGIKKSLYHDTLALGNRGDRTEMINILLNAGINFKQVPKRAVVTIIGETKLSPYDYAKEYQVKWPELTYIQGNLDLVDNYK